MEPRYYNHCFWLAQTAANEIIWSRYSRSEKVAGASSWDDAQWLVKTWSRRCSSLHGDNTGLPNKGTLKHLFLISRIKQNTLKRYYCSTVLQIQDNVDQLKKTCSHEFKSLHQGIPTAFRHFLGIFSFRELFKKQSVNLTWDPKKTIWKKILKVLLSLFI